MQTGSRRYIPIKLRSCSRFVCPTLSHQSFILQQQATWTHSTHQRLPLINTNSTCVYKNARYSYAPCIGPYASWKSGWHLWPEDREREIKYRPVNVCKYANAHGLCALGKVRILEYFEIDNQLCECEQCKSREFSYGPVHERWEKRWGRRY